jgi:putative ATPase
MSACTSGVADVKEAVKAAKNDLRMFKRKTILFIDEVHRFNKAQQDAFLPHVEDGTITLLGATTENPSFSLNSALLSRCRVVPLAKLNQDAVLAILQRAVSAATNHTDGVRIDEDAIKYLSGVADGDARTALNCLQIAVDSARHKGVVTLEDAKASLMRSHVLYDRNGDEHFHCISAMHKSIRGSNANAALYWTMRMLAGGEDPVYVARRLVRAASEDVGLADPQALPLAVSAMQGCQMLGKPECNVLLAQCSVYLARANKSHEIMDAMSNVLKTFEDTSSNLPPVPIHLRNASSKLATQMGYGKGYTHDLAVTHELQYMPEGMESVNFFKPND